MIKRDLRSFWCNQGKIDKNHHKENKIENIYYQIDSTDIHSQIDVEKEMTFAIGFE